MSVYGTDEESFQLGHLDISRSTVGWNSLPICPSGSSNEASDKYLTFTGSSGLNFSVEIAQVENIKLDERREFTISPSNRIEVFQFIPTEDISDKQLDVTVISESADVPAYLKVSRVCKDVKDNIDDVDYKGESLRLSFAKKGRITLSKFSVPPLTDSTTSWFIGIARKNASGNTSFYATKTVILTLTRSFDYMYSKPLGILVPLVSIFGGFLVSFWAWCSFRNNIVKPSTHKLQKKSTREGEAKQLLNKEKEPEEKKEEQVTIIPSKEEIKEFLSAMFDVISSYSLARGPKTYSYITFIVGSVLMVGAFQFVFANWYLMIQEGDRDNCYYNDFCYRVRYYDIPYNLMISNVAYVIHGLILAVNVLYMESELLARCKKLADAAKNDAKRRNDKYALNQTELDQNQPSQTEPDQTQSAQTGPDQTQSAQTGPDQNQYAQAEPDRKQSAKTGPDRKQSAQTGPDHNQSAQTGPDRNQSAQTKPDQIQSIKSKPPYKHLPNHVLKCPDISFHLETMLVPQYKIAEKKAQEMFAEARKKRFTFTIGYAFAWALIFEGFFSSLYHLCPSKLTFQFDTAFMFVIASLIVILLYNGIELQECSINVTDRVGAANFFLYFLVPLYFFNYLGTMYHSEAGLITSVSVAFFSLLLIWCLCMVWWASYKLYPETCSEIWSKCKQGKEKEKQEEEEEEEVSHNEPNNADTCEKVTKAFFCFVSFVVVPIALLIPFLTESIDIPKAFLIACIAECLVAVFGKVLVKIIRFCKNFCCGCCAFKQCTCQGCRDCKKCTCTCECTCKWLCFILKILYVIVTLGTGTTALVFFYGMETTDKVKTPEKSRDLNRECIDGLNFFDYHDIWHILSSFTLLMGALMMLHVSYKPPTKEKKKEPSTAGNNYGGMGSSTELSNPC